MNLNEAIDFMKKKHERQKRKQGTPYYTHPLAVYNLLKEKGYNNEYLFVALFHDLLEDTNTTYNDILKLTDQKIADSVLLLTKQNGYIMEDYISNIKKNEIARIVKIADRIHNLQESIYADNSFQERYILETEKYFIDLAKGTILEKDLITALNNLKKHIKIASN